MNFEEETLVALTDVPPILPKRRGKKVHYSTVYRWTSKGARGRVLESQLLGGVRFTSLEALNRFFNTTTIQARNSKDALELRRVLYGSEANETS